MSSIVFRPATERELIRWDDLIAKSINGTIFHTRAFLSYHGDRFAGKDRWIVAAKGSDVLALLAYAECEDADGRCIAASPFGASYGGVVLMRMPSYSEASKIVDALLAHLAMNGIDACRLTPPVACCSLYSLDVFTFALLERGFRSESRDVSSIVALGLGQIDKLVDSRARNMERKALHAGVEVNHSAPIHDYWVPMDETFSRHGTLPTHSRRQLEDLCARLPDAIWLDVAYWRGLPTAGICYFRINPRVISSFYFCQTERGQELQSLNLLVMEGLRRAQRDGYAWMDFGTSTVGMQARANVFRFKESFSRQGMFRETLQWIAP
jgi:hypothetical protein